MIGHTNKQTEIYTLYIQIPCNLVVIGLNYTFLTAFEV